MEFLGSMTEGSTKACVGQASRQRRQLPHKSGGGSSFAPSDGSRSSVVRITPRNKKEPSSWLSSSEFIPSHPKPAHFTLTRSRTEPASRQALPTDYRLHRTARS